MSRMGPLGHIAVSIIIGRQKAKGAWAEFVWRAVAALPGVPETAPWTIIDSSDDCTRFYGGSAQIDLYRSDVSGYRENLARGTALLWVMLRPTGRETSPYEISAVTAEPSLGEALAENASDLVDTVPMPEAVRSVIAEFVAENCMENAQVIARDRSSQEATARSKTWDSRK
jgi:hypothetical protein